MELTVNRCRGSGSSDGREGSTADFADASGSDGGAG